VSLENDGVRLMAYAGDGEVRALNRNGNDVTGSYPGARRAGGDPRRPSGRRRRQQFYRLIHGDNIVDGLDIATVEGLLAEAGVGMADLVQVDAGAVAGSVREAG
jgi:hypothetical protein